MQQTTGTVSNVGSSSEIVQYFNQDIPKQILSGDSGLFYHMVADLATTLYPIDYVAIVKDGQVIEDRAKPGLTVDPTTVPIAEPEAGYDTLNSLGNKEGFFIEVFFTSNLNMYGLGILHGVGIVDRTAELADINKYFSHQRNDLILGMSIAAIIALILSILITTLGLRYFTNKYVVKPIEKLNRTAETIVQGTFEGDVEVDEKSAYAALQGLLQSGQKVLRQMEEYTEEDEE